MTDIKAKLKMIVEKKKKEDPSGYQRAEKSDELPSFLATELRAAGISTKDYLKATGLPPEHLSTLSEDFEGYVNTISNSLDDNLFEPYYEHNLPSNHLGLSEVMQTFRQSRKIHNRLKTMKVVAAVASVLTFAMAIRKFTHGSPISGAASLLLSADLLRVSYNCYIKRYCSAAINMFGGSAKKVANTILKMAQSAVGLTEPEDDPLLRLKHDVLYEVLVEDTISKVIYEKARETLKPK